ncbi:MAG: protein phosphatase 2C domain-containing protein [Candidatus Neomarinimicrobiota bacterium]
MRLSFSGNSDIGLVRKVNQDRWSHIHCDWGDLFVVADGLGHEEGGQFASQSTVDQLKERFSERDPEDTPGFLQKVLTEINEAIFREKVGVYRKAMMASTCVALVIQEESAYLAHVGDSRAYYLHDGELMQLTKDQSLVQEMVDEGLISKEQAESHPNKNIVTEALGAQADVNVNIREESLSLSPGDRFLLCSDGLWGSVSRNRLHEILAHEGPDDAVAEFIDLARQNGGADNITVQVIYVG